MKLQVLRISSQQDSTNGILFDITDGKKEFLCYTLEDEYRDEKVMHETRIPEGTYKLTLRTAGGFHNRYLNRYGADWHKGMIYVNEVSGFEWILWHTGNTDESTSGCLILGLSQQENINTPNGFVGNSKQAYAKVYPLVRDAILSGKEVTVDYVDYDHVDKKQKPKAIVDPAKDKVEPNFPKWPGVYFRLKKPLMYSEKLKPWQEAVGLKADGWYGRGSFAKVKEIQKTFGLTPDGVLGPNTWSIGFVKK